MKNLHAQDNILHLTIFNTMNLNERISILVEQSGMSLPKFAVHIGVKTPQAIRDLISGKTQSLSKDMSTKILSAIPNLNEAWLYTGEGEMYGQVEVQNTSMVPLINIDSVGGVWSENTSLSSEQFVERLIPLPDSRPGDVAILQSGDSMNPHIPAGAILQIRKIEDWREYFGYGNVYVLWLRDDRRITKLVKRYNEDPQNYVLCCSYNPDAADEELPRKFIREVWKVVNVLINKGW